MSELDFLYEDTFEHPLDAYDLILYQEEELCYYKDKEVLLSTTLFKYLLLLAKNKGAFVSYETAYKELSMKIDNVDKTKQRINKAFKDQLNLKTLKIIENKTNRGNRIAINPNLIKVLKNKF